MKMTVFNASWHDRTYLDPRTKLLLLVVLSVTLFVGTTGGPAIWIRPILFAVPVILTFASGRSMQGNVWTLIFAVCWYCENYMLYADGATGIIASIIIGVVAKMAPTIAMAIYLVNSTTIGELIAAMQKLHIPAFVTIPMAVVFRFLPTIAEESAAIKESMRLRGIKTKNPITYLEYHIVPLLISVTRIGDELSAAALTKGLGAPTKRVPVVDVRFNVFDVLFAGITVFTAIAYIIAGG